MVWQVEGLSEYDARRPMTLGYFGNTFGRPSGIPLPPNDDMFLAADETRERVLDLYRTAWAYVVKVERAARAAAADA